MAERRQQDRRRKRRFVLHERRSGFDRRRQRPGNRVAVAWESSLLYLRDTPSALVAVLLLANLLSVLDLLFTLWALRHGAVEANPFMHQLLDTSPGAAAFVKVALVAGLSLLIFALRRYRAMLAVSLVALILFFVLLLYHSFGSVVLM